MVRILDYWKEFFIDLKIWWRFRKTAIRSEAFLNENGMRVDFLGRIYTVVNVPEEVENNMPTVQQGWVIGQLKPMNEVLMKIGLADYAYPDISPIDGAASYLVVMYPEIDSLNLWRIISNIVALGIIGGLLWVAYFTINYFGLIDLVKDLKK